MTRSVVQFCPLRTSRRADGHPLCPSFPHTHTHTRTGHQFLYGRCVLKWSSTASAEGLIGEVSFFGILMLSHGTHCMGSLMNLAGLYSTNSSFASSFANRSLSSVPASLVASTRASPGSVLVATDRSSSSASPCSRGSLLTCSDGLTGAVDAIGPAGQNPAHARHG